MDISTQAYTCTFSNSSAVCLISLSQCNSFTSLSTTLVWLNGTSSKNSPWNAMWWVFYKVPKAGVMIFFFLNLIHFKRGITVVPLFSCFLCLLSHPSKRLWEASHLSSKIRVTLEMSKHIITFKHAILSGEKIEKGEAEKKGVPCFEAFYDRSLLFSVIREKELTSLPDKIHRTHLMIITFKQQCDSISCYSFYLKLNLYRTKIITQFLSLHVLGVYVLFMSFCVWVFVVLGEYELKQVYIQVYISFLYTNIQVWTVFINKIQK